jgi:hypothetical protein
VGSASETRAMLLHGRPSTTLQARLHPFSSVTRGTHSDHGLPPPMSRRAIRHLYSLTQWLQHGRGADGFGSL